MFDKTQYQAMNLHYLSAMKDLKRTAYQAIKDNDFDTALLAILELQELDEGNDEYEFVNEYAQQWAYLASYDADR